MLRIHGFFNSKGPKIDQTSGRFWTDACDPWCKNRSAAMAVGYQRTHDVSWAFWHIISFIFHGCSWMFMVSIRHGQKEHRPGRSNLPTKRTKKPITKDTTTLASKPENCVWPCLCPRETKRWLSQKCCALVKPLRTMYAFVHLSLFWVKNHFLQISPSPSPSPPPSSSSSSSSSSSPSPPWVCPPVHHPQHSSPPRN